MPGRQGDPATDAPTRDFLVFGRPALGEEEIAEVVDSLRSGWVGTGPKVARFERDLSAYVGAPNVRCVSSCTAGLYLALRLSGIGEGDEVIVPSMTFLATANAVEHAGATPVIVDVEPATGHLDLDAAAAAVTPRTRAVIPVHLGGRPVDLDALAVFAQAHDLVVVEDAAHAIGAAWRGRRIGAHGNLTSFSFYANKNICTGDGGALVCPDERFFERVGRVARQGLAEDAWSVFTRGVAAEHDADEAGFKFAMGDLQAALGIHQLARLDASIALRAEQWRAYDEALAGLPLTLPAAVPEHLHHARHLYQVLVDADAPLDRDDLAVYLRDHGIGSGVHYRAIHLHRFYRNRYDIDPDALPVARDISTRTMSLPIGPGVREDDQAHVIATLRAALT